jgi:hypothetical protein
MAPNETPKCNETVKQFQDSPNLEGQVPVFIPPRNRVTLGSLFAAFYDSKGYDGGIRPHFHTGYFSYFPFIVY